MTNWLKRDCTKVERSLDARQVFKDEFLAIRLINFAVCESKTLELLAFNLLLKFSHQVDTKHSHQVA